MELYQLRSFAAVAEQGQLTRAAERLHISQPALSAQIKALEDELSVVLFERGSGGMTLTAAGRQLLPEAERVLAAAQSLLAQARAFRGEIAGRVSLGNVGDAELTRLAEVLRCSVERSPLIEIDVRHEVSGAAFEKVRDGDLDAGFYYGELVHPAVASLVLRDLPFCIVVPAGWSKRLHGASWETLAAEPWIMTPPISSHTALTTGLFSAHGVAPARSVEADHEALIASLVTAELGVALLREDLAIADAAKGGIAIWGDTRVATRLQFVYRREREHDPVIHATREVVRDVWNPRPATEPHPQRASQPASHVQRRPPA